MHEREELPLAMEAAKEKWGGHCLSMRTLTAWPVSPAGSHCEWTGSTR